MVPRNRLHKAARHAGRAWLAQPPPAGEAAIRPANRASTKTLITEIMPQSNNDAPGRQKAAPSRPSLPEEITIPPRTYGSWMELGLAARQMATAAATPAPAAAPARRRPRAQARSISSIL
jgi:hypothetical protein